MPNHKELQYFLPKQFLLSSQKYGFGIRDRESEIRDTRAANKWLCIGETVLYRCQIGGIEAQTSHGKGLYAIYMNAIISWVIQCNTMFCVMVKILQ